jgi:hypothetical protein
MTGGEKRGMREMMQTGPVQRGDTPSLTRTALVALLILGSLSEALYLGLGLIATRCLTEGGGCHVALDILSRALFIAGVAEDGTPRIYNAYSFGLPGFNNLFYTWLSPVSATEQTKFAETVAVSLVAGFMAIAGFLATARGRSGVAKFGLAILFGIAWFLLYNLAEFSIFKADALLMLPSRAPEVPIATLALLFLLPWTRSPAATSDTTSR